MGWGTGPLSDTVTVLAVTDHTARICSWEAQDVLSDTIAPRGSRASPVQTRN